MPLVDMKHMLNHAYEHGYAIAAFDVFSVDVIAGVISAAERDQAPVILSLKDHAKLKLLAPALEQAAIQTSVPVAISLSHCGSVASGVNGIKLGCNGLSLDSKHLPGADQIQLTRDIANMAHACGVPICASTDLCLTHNETGIRSSGLSLAPTDVLVHNCNPDFIGIHIDTRFNHSTDSLTLRPEHVNQLKQLANRPLVLENGSGLTQEQYRGLIQYGVAHINFDSVLLHAADECLHHNLEHGALGYRETIKGMRNALMKAAQRCIRFCGCPGKAPELLKACTPWSPVEHLIIYNTGNTSEQQVRVMMQEGKRVLGAIPGVRKVFTGQAVQESAGYRYSWLVQFCHPAVIDSYREHPDHIAFADKLFRPIAGDRISIDYQEQAQSLNTNPIANNSAKVKETPVS